MSTTQNLISVLNVTLASDAEVTLPHGLVSASQPVAPFEVTCDRPSTIGVLSANDTTVTFKNLGATEATAVFRVVREHSVSTDPKALVAWRGWAGTTSPVGPAGGDLFGTYPNPLVYGLEGYPIEGPPPSNGDAIIFNSTLGIWEHAPIVFGGGPPVGPASRDLGGIYPDPLVVGLQNSPLAPTIADGFIKRNAGNTAWEEVAYGSAANTVCEGNDPRLSDDRIPMGAAGNDLDGTYPDPTVVGLQTRPVSPVAPNEDELLAWRSGAWTPTALSDILPVAVNIYGSFSDTTDQSIPTKPNVLAVKYDTVEMSNGVTVSNNLLGQPTRLTVPVAGIYSFDISPQLLHPGGTGTTIYFWAKVNGTNVPRSGSSLDMGNNNNRVLPFLQLELQMAAGDYLEWFFTQTGAGTNLEHFPAEPLPPAAEIIPAIPSVIVNVKRFSAIP